MQEYFELKRLVIAYSTGQWWPPAVTFYAAWKTYQYEKLLSKETK